MKTSVCGMSRGLLWKVVDGENLTEHVARVIVGMVFGVALDFCLRRPL